MNKSGLIAYGLILASAVSLSFTWSVPVQATEIYKTVDADGNVVYSDRPPNPQAKPMDLPALSVVSKRRPAMPAADGGSGQAGAAQSLFKDVTFASPQPEESFWGTGNTLNAALELAGPLPQGFQVIFYLDGTALPPVPESSAEIGNIPRGEHQVSAEIINRQGRIVAAVAPVTFYMKQHSALFNRGG